MITIEGQDFYNYAEALLYLFSLYEDVYTREEIDEIIGNLPKGVTEEQFNAAISGINADILAIKGRQSELNNAVNFLDQRLADAEQELTTKLTDAQVREIVQEELGVIENGTY